MAEKLGTACIAQCLRQWMLLRLVPQRFLETQRGGFLLPGKVFLCFGILGATSAAEMDAIVVARRSRPLLRWAARFVSSRIHGYWCGEPVSVLLFQEVSLVIVWD